MSFGFTGLKRIIVGMAVVLMISAQFTVSASQYPTVTLKLPVSQTFKNSTGENVDDTFTYRIKAADQNNPMPNGIKGNTFSIEGTKEMSLEITFDRVGIYEYEIKQDSANKRAGYTNDSTVYTVTVYVRNDEADGLKTDLLIQNQDGNKVERLEFTNSYKTKDTTEDSTHSGKETKTGDIMLWPFYMLFLCGTVIAGICIKIKQLQR